MTDDASRRFADATRVVHAGLPTPEDGTPFLPGPVFAAPYHFAGEVGEISYGYGRAGNPTWEAYEAAIGELEAGSATVFASGMAAVTALLLSRLRPGDVLVLPSDAYYNVRVFAAEHLATLGVEVRMEPTGSDAFVAATCGATLVWLETPSNPGLDVCDIAAVTRAAHAEGALVAVDNTFATPLAQRPLDLGADFSVASATKHLTGHSDLLLGYVACRDEAAAGAITAWRTLTGAIPGPFETWLAHRSLATLEVRFRRQCETAVALATALTAHEGTTDIRYPGLETHPAHELARRQMRYFGSVLTFTLPDRERADGFLGALDLTARATSFGGVHSTAERRARWASDDVPEGFIRFSCGCEATDDVVADVLCALEAAGHRSLTP